MAEGARDQGDEEYTPHLTLDQHFASSGPSARSRHGGRMIAIETSARQPWEQAAELVRLKDAGVAPSKITERWNIIATV